MNKKQIASYGIGAGAGVIEYYALKKILEPAPPLNVGRTNVVSAIVGAGMLIAGFTKIIPEKAGKGMLKNAVVANGLTLIALAILQGREEGFALQSERTSVFVSANTPNNYSSQPRPMSGCSSCNQASQATQMTPANPQAFTARSTCPKCWPPGGVYS